MEATERPGIYNEILKTPKGVEPGVYSPEGYYKE
jgi:hypothetical protein